MLTAAIWCAAFGVYGLYAQNPMLHDGSRRSIGENIRTVIVSIGALAIFPAAILATIAVNV